MEYLILYMVIGGVFCMVLDAKAYLDGRESEFLPSFAGIVGVILLWPFLLLSLLFED